MEQNDLDQVLERAHQASVHLMTIAGLVSGLLLGIGFLGLQSGNARFAVGIWAVALAVALGLAVAARQLRNSATSIMEVGMVALTTRSHAESMQAAMTQRLGELQSQLQRVQADVDRYLRTPPSTGDSHDHDHHHGDHALAATTALDLPG